jgi:hypothetical protein
MGRADISGRALSHLKRSSILLAGTDGSSLRAPVRWLECTGSDQVPGSAPRISTQKTDFSAAPPPKALGQPSGTMFVVNATTMLRVNQGERREHRRCHFLLALSGRKPAHVLLGGCLGDAELAAARRFRESTALRSGPPPSSYSPPLSRSARSR